MNSQKNLAYLRTVSTKEHPELGAKLYETLQAILSQQDTLSQQVNGNATGDPAPPGAINNLKVTGQNGHFNIAIQDANPLYRGVRYYAEYDTSPHFSNPRVVPMGDSRNHNLFLGNGTYYWRAYSAYGSSASSAPAYHGSSAQPLAVSGGGSIGGPDLQDSEGSGTGTPRQGLSGPGPVPFRSTNGKPPTRS